MARSSRTSTRKSTRTSSRRRKKEFPHQLAGIVILEIAAIVVVFQLVQWTSAERSVMAEDSPPNVGSFLASFVDFDAAEADQSAESISAIAPEYAFGHATTFPISTPAVEQSASDQRAAELQPIVRTRRDVARRDVARRDVARRDVYPYPDPAEFAATGTEFSLPKASDRRYNRRW